MPHLPLSLRKRKIELATFIGTKTIQQQSGMMVFKGLLAHSVVMLCIILASDGLSINATSSNTDRVQDLRSPPNDPVIFIPGDGGSQLMAKLNKTSRVHFLCDLKSDWFDLWLNIHLLAPLAFDCLSDNLRLIYNWTDRLTYNSPGVEIRPANFGSLDSVDYLDLYKLPKTDYFDQIIVTLESELGYGRNKNMLGAPFDFRKAPNELGEFFNNLTSLIHKSFVDNNYKPVTLICHSMGCLNSIYFLNRQSQQWKDSFVKRLISLAAPWTGSFKAINAMVFGDNLGVPLLNSEKLQALQSTFPSLMYLFPRNPTFADDRVLVETPDVNYTLKNLDSFFEVLDLLDQREMWHDTRTIAAGLRAPNVELWCLYGSNISTPSQIIYDSPVRDKRYTVLEGDGDGTVNLNSLRACEDFTGEQTQPVYLKEFEGVDHIGMIRDQKPAKFIAEHILAQKTIPHDASQ